MYVYARTTDSNPTRPTSAPAATGTRPKTLGMSSSAASAKGGANASAGESKNSNGSADDGSDSSSDSTAGQPDAALAMSITSEEVNFLVYRYLQESGKAT